jgi:hypothetical protein
LEEAGRVRPLALNAVRELKTIAPLAVDLKNDPTLRAIRKALGASIWQIDRDVLSVVYAEYPERNVLKEMHLTQFGHLFGE